MCNHGMTTSEKQNAGRIYDMHTHSESSHDSVCPVEDMAKAAEKNGLAGFAVTDHCDVEFCETVDLHEVVRSSHAAAEKAKEKFNIEILRGIEICEMFWYPAAAEKVLRDFDYDVVIGSVHAAAYDGCKKPYSQIKPGDVDPKEYMRIYFNDMLKMVREWDFDILAHMTCPLRYFNGKYGMNVNVTDYEEQIREILSEIIPRGIALEVNTSCVYPGSGYAEFLPNDKILRMYKDMGGELITVGSDAHIAENSALSFDKAYAMLKDIGFKNTYFYKNRRACACEII